jgi:hypothetical protein
VDKGSASAPSGVGTVAAWLVTGALVLVGCGSSGHSGSAGRSGGSEPPSKRPSVCLPAARDAIERFVGVGAGSVGGTPATGNNAQPECHFRARAGDGRRVGVVANVDTAPQPYERLERTIVEDGQQFGQTRGFTPPQTVPRLGLDATWLPDQAKLLTTDGTRLISVSVAWPGAGQARRRALADAAARPYLGRLQPKAAIPTGS